jgi:hypothetical protein
MTEVYGRILCRPIHLQAGGVPLAPFHRGWRRVTPDPARIARPPVSALEHDVA